MAYESKGRYFTFYISLFRYHKLGFCLVFGCYNVLILYLVSGNKHYRILVPTLVLWTVCEQYPYSIGLILWVLLASGGLFSQECQSFHSRFLNGKSLPLSLLNMTASILISFSLTTFFTSSQSIMKSQYLPHMADSFLVSQASYLACHTLTGISSL